MAKSKNSFQPPRGMRDVYPEDMRLRNQLFDAWRSSAERHGFSHYDACVVESLDLLKRKAGEEIVDQIYAFQDKSGRDLALRPEMTPTLARMVAAKQGSLTFPLKWFTIAQCFRYERTTRGRKREHFQWNLDIIGEPSLQAEAEVIAAAVDGMRTLGLGAKDIVIDFSNRAMLSDVLSNLGIKADDHAAAFVALDKRGKIPDEQIKAILAEYGLSEGCVGKVFDVLGIQSMDDVASVLSRDCASYQDLLRFVDLMDTYGLAAHMNFNIGVIRGLAYYTGIVFEAFDAGRELRAVFGGGRYDNLLSSIGGAPATAVGLGFGDVVIGDLLAMKQADGDVLPRGGTVIGYLEEAQRPVAIKVAVALRKEGNNVDLALSPEKAKKFFQRCNRDGFAEAVYIGPDDQAKGVVRLKNLATREEREMGI